MLNLCRDRAWLGQVSLLQLSCALRHEFVMIMVLYGLVGVCVCGFSICVCICYVLSLEPARNATTSDAKCLRNGSVILRQWDRVIHLPRHMDVL
jgi:hypothetical protein